MEQNDVKPPGTEKEFPNQPEIVVEKAHIIYRRIPKGELPESLDEFAWYPQAYGYFKKLDKGKYAAQYPSQYYFNQYFKEMYRRAREQGTVLYYEYNGEVTVDFPMENTENKVRMYASFIRNKAGTPPWFCWGIRKGGKLTDFAVLGNIETDYRHAQNMTDLAAAGIGSQYAFRRYLEDKFIEALESDSVYRYVQRDAVCYEYPLELPSQDGGRTVTATFSCAYGSVKWRFQRLSYRETRLPLAEMIRRDESRLWRRTERGNIRKEQEQREAELKKAEFLKKEAERNLIPFEPFPLRKVSNPVAGEYYSRVEKFAFLNTKIYCYDRELGIDLRDSDVILDAVTAAFAACRPYVDIDYYENSGKKSAELRVKFPGYEDRIMYAHFVPNVLQNKQPWHLDRLVDGTIFQRTFRGIDCANLYEKFCRVAGSDAFASAEEFAAYIEQEFVKALSSGSLWYYGEPAKKQVELPLSVRSSAGNAVHLVFKQTADRKYKWAFAGFRERTGEDVRFCISDEYKEGLTEIEPEPVEVIADECEPAYSKPTVKKPEKPQFKGTSFPGPDGKPINLANFCKQISIRKLRQLAEMAEEEQWGWGDEEPLELLYKYLNARFVRLGYERKIGYSQAANELDYVVFHTGLFSRDVHDPIYACLKPVPQFNPLYGGPKWFLDGFCCRSEGGPVYDRMVARFSVLPPDADFMHSDGEYLPLSSYQMDLSRNIELKEEHILKERGYRLPHKFLERAFKACKDRTAQQYLQKLTSIADELDQKEFWLNEFSVYLENNQETYDKLLQLVGYAVEEAVRCNVRHPIPAYYPRDNTLNWLLPLRFYDETDLKNLVLVVGLREAGGYKGITVMTMEMVYHHARAFANPESYWLKTEILDNYVIDEWAYDAAEEKDDEYDELYAYLE